MGCNNKIKQKCSRHKGTTCKWISTWFLPCTTKERSWWSRAFWHEKKNNWFSCWMPHTYLPSALPKSYHLLTPPCLVEDPMMVFDSLPFYKYMCNRSSPTFEALGDLQGWITRDLCNRSSSTLEALGKPWTWLAVSGVLCNQTFPTIKALGNPRGWMAVVRDLCNWSWNSI